MDGRAGPPQQLRSCPFLAKKQQMGLGRRSETEEETKKATNAVGDGADPAEAEANGIVM